MKGDEIKAIREKLEINRIDFAEFMGLANYGALTNIETGFRNPSKFTLKILRYLNSLPKKKALALIQEIKEFKE